MNLAGGLLAEGRAEEAAAVFRELLAADPSSALLYEAGTTLLRFEQHALAHDFLERAVAETPAAHLDLAISVYFTAGPQAALKASGKGSGWRRHRRLPAAESRSSGCCGTYRGSGSGSRRESATCHFTAAAGPGGRLVTHPPSPERQSPGLGDAGFEIVRKMPV